MDLSQSVGRFISTLMGTPRLVIQNKQENVGKPPVYPAANINTYINAFNTNATIFTLISYISQKFGNVPRYMYEIEDEKAAKALKSLLKQKGYRQKDIEKLSVKAYGETVISPDITPQGKLATLTNRPNDYQGQDSYYAEAYMQYELCGECFIYLNRGETTDAAGVTLDDDAISKMPVLEKRVLPTQFVTIVPSKEDISQVLYYRFESTPGNFIPIRPVDMIHWRKLNPNYDGFQGTHLRGLAPLTAGLKLLTQDNSATDASVAMQQNQGAKGFINYEDPQFGTDPIQTGKVSGVVDEKINNPYRKGAVAVLGGGKANYHNIGLSSIDLDLGASQQQVFIRLCNLFGIPPAIFLTETTYENLQQAGKSLLTNKILPACCSLRDEENRVLLPSFGLDASKFTTDIDATMLPELAEDMGELTTQLSLANWKTLNEKREATGDEPLPDDNMDKIYVQNTLISLDDLSISDGLDSFTGTGGAGTSNPLDGSAGDQSPLPAGKKPAAKP